MRQISVIIVSWNACSYLRNCLYSIREMGVSQAPEVIVVDNASNDGSAEMVAKEFPEAKLIRSPENLGFARANNLGMKHATGLYLAFINSDVVVHSGCFERLIRYMEAHPEAGLAGPKIWGGDGRLQRTCRRLPTVWNTMCSTLALERLFPHWPLFSGFEMRHLNDDTPTEVEALSGCFWLARRLSVEKVGGLDERFFFYAEDVDWCKRFKEAGYIIIFLPNATAIHFGGGSSSNAPLRFSIEILRANFLYWKKHHGLIGWVVFYLFSIVYHGLRFAVRGVLKIMGISNGVESKYKLKEHAICLRWLFTGKGA